MGRAALAVMVLASAAHAQDSARSPILDDRERAVQVIRFFADKCAECHGSQLEKPKGDLGFILDLPRLIEEKMVRPGKPDDSDVYIQLKKGKMPPEKARGGPASPEQVELVREWIAGAPAGAVAAPEAARGAPHPLVLLGRLHPLTVHFPIALLIGAALAEAVDAARKQRSLAIARNFCVGLGAAGAVAAAGLGWLMAWADAKSGPTLELHRWLGTGAAVVAVAAAVLTVRNGTRPTLVRAGLLAGAALVGVAAHFGGMLVFGAGFFS